MFSKVKCWLLVIFFAVCKATQALPLNNDVLLDKIKDLRPLPKVHYSWGLQKEFLDNRDNRLLYELAGKAGGIGYAYLPCLLVYYSG